MLVLPSRKKSGELIRFDDIDFVEHEHPHHLLRKKSFKPKRASFDHSGEVQAVSDMLNALTRGEQVSVRSGKRNNHTFDLFTRSKETGWIAIAERGLKNNFELVFFPEPNHAANYYRAGLLSLAGGPAAQYPGAVGVLEYSFCARTNCGFLNVLQSCVNHSIPEVGDLLTSEGRNLSVVYLHWKSELVKLAFDFFYRMGAERVNFKQPDSTHFEDEEIINPQIIAAAATSFRSMKEVSPIGSES